MKYSIILKYAWEEEDDGVDEIGEDSTVGVVVVVGGLLSDNDVMNQSFNNFSLSAIKPMPLR